MPLCVVFYTDRLVGDGFSGCARGPFIFIRPKARHDLALLEHEKVHVRQFWRTLGMHGLLYRFSRAYRLRAEVEAYRRQLEIDPTFYVGAAELLTEKYDLGITKRLALELLM